MQNLGAFGVLVMALSLGAPAAADPSAPLTPDRAGAVPCTGAPANIDDIAVNDAIERRIDDAPMLRFIEGLKRAGVPERTLVAQRVATDAPVVLPPSDDAAERCRVKDAPYAAVRAGLVGLRLWKIDGNAVDRFATAANAALTAIALRDTLPETTVDAALAPFDTTLAVVQTAPVPPAQCAKPDAAPAIVAPAKVTYPALGAVERESAVVTVRVSLDSEGHVVSATTEDNSASIQEFGPQFAEQALISAALTTFTSGLHGCVPEASSYAFRVHFRFGYLRRNAI